MELNEKGELLVKDLSKSISKITNNCHYNGGWQKSIKGLDKSKTDGFSLLGSFINSPIWIMPDSLILDCSIEGSRKNQVKYYSLLKIEKNATLTLLQTVKQSKQWAVDLWPIIEKNLITEKPNPLEKYSNEELLTEVKRRNL